jgi:hypothetical protein
MRRALFAALFVASAAQAAAAADVTLGLDEVHTLTFKRPVATVYVGNPAIADITMIDARHAFVLGKGYGHTNIVALNHEGAQVFNTEVTVLGGGTPNTVTLNRGAQRVTYNCAGGRCEPAPMPGDGKDSYDLMNGQMSTHQDNARKAASGG